MQYVIMRIIALLTLILPAFLLAPPASAQNIVATAGITVVVIPVVTPTTNYSAGNEVGGIMRFNGSGRANTFSGVIESVQITFQSVQAGEFDLYLCDSNPTASVWADNTPAAIAVADVVRCKWVVPLTAVKNGLGTHSVYIATGVGIEFDLPQPNPSQPQTALWGVLVTPGAPSAQFSAANDVTVSIGILQD